MMARPGFKEQSMKTSEIDPIVKAIFDAVNQLEVSTTDKWNGVRRAGQIAESYLSPYIAGRPYGSGLILKPPGERAPLEET